MAKCANCNSKVEDGAVKCSSCGQDLSTGALFLQVLGWVLGAVSTIPLGLGVVFILEGGNDYTILGIGVGVLLLAIVLLVTGRMQSSGTTPPVVNHDAVASDGG